MNQRNDNNKTITFSIKEEEREIQRREALRSVYEALVEKGYNPLNQLVGYILTEDPTYITNHKNARAVICKIDRDELMASMIKEYLDI